MNKSGRNLKQYDLSGSLVNSIALFIFFYDQKQSVIETFNDWAKSTGVIFREAETISLVLEHIKRIKALEKKDLEKALIKDGFLTKT